MRQVPLDPSRHVARAGRRPRHAESTSDRRGVCDLVADRPAHFEVGPARVRAGAALRDRAAGLSRLAYDLAWLLVGARSEERRLANVSRGGPLGEANFDHEQRLDEAHTFWHPTAGERTRVERTPLEESFELGDDRPRQSASDFARVDELVAVGVTDEERTNAPGAALLPRLPAADDELLAQLVFHL